RSSCRSVPPRPCIRPGSLRPRRRSPPRPWRLPAIRQRWQWFASAIPPTYRRRLPARRYRAAAPARTEAASGSRSGDGLHVGFQPVEDAFLAELGGHRLPQELAAHPDREGEQLLLRLQQLEELLGLAREELLEFGGAD